MFAKSYVLTLKIPKQLLEPCPLPECISAVPIVEPTFAQTTFVQPTFTQPTFTQATFTQATFAQPTDVQPIHHTAEPVAFEDTQGFGLWEHTPSPLPSVMVWKEQIDTEQHIWSECKQAYSRETWPSHSDRCCAYDGHPFTTMPVMLPMQWDGCRFEVLSDWHFCSFACAQAFVEETSLLPLFRKPDVTSLLIMLYNAWTGHKIHKLPRAPNRMMLQSMCGNHGLSIEDFRSKEQAATRLRLYLPPMRATACVLEFCRLDKPLPNNQERLAKHKPLPVQVI